MEIDWPRRLRQGIVALAALILALRGQVLLQGHTYVVDGVLLYVVATAGFLWAFGRSPREAPLETTASAAPISHLGRRLAWAGAIATLVSAPFFAGNRFRPLGVLLWVGGLACFVAALDDGPSPARMWTQLRERLAPDGFRVSWTGAALIAITLAGVFFRFYRLDVLPADMHADIGHLWVDTERILHGDYLIFSTIHPGREIMMFYLTAGYVRLLGHSYFAHKAVAAVVGTATVPLVYLLGRQSFNQRVGLLAAFFLAVAKWPVVMSRIGWRLVLGPPFVVLTCFFLVRALRDNRRRNWLLAGLALGLSLYTYNALRAFVPGVALALAAYGLLAEGGLLSQSLGNLGLAGWVTVSAFVPMGWFMLEDPERFWFRIATRLTAREAAIPGHPVIILLRNVWRTLLMFNYQGDHVSLANPPSTPQLDSVLAPLFVLGMAYCLVRWRKGVNALLLVIFGSLMLPGALSLAFPQEVPSAVRTSSALGVLFLFPAVGLDVLWQAVRQLSPVARYRWVGSAALFILLGWFCQLNFNAYFTDYESSLPNRNYPFHRMLAEAIDDFADVGPAYIKYVPYWVDGDVVRLQLLRQPAQWNNVVPAVPFDAIELAPQQQFLVILHPSDSEALAELEAHYPRHAVLPQHDYYGELAFLKFIGVAEGG